jgi:hypothetical protein
MKYCYQCGRMTSGEPLFCTFCGCSYDVKLCPRMHTNPRYAEVCSQCGSREFSTPQPKVPFRWRAFSLLAKIVVGIFLLYASFAAVVALLARPETQGALVGLGILVALLWWLWAELPDWIRKLVRRSLRRKERTHDR